MDGRRDGDRVYIAPLDVLVMACNGILSFTPPFHFINILKTEN